MIEDLKTSKDRVGFLLENYPALRDSDKKLWVAYLSKFCGMRKSITSSANPWDTFRTILYAETTPTMESIRRVRQKYQEGGKFLGTKRKEKLAEAELVKDWSLTTKY